MISAMTDKLPEEKEWNKILRMQNYKGLWVNLLIDRSGDCMRVLVSFSKKNRSLKNYDEANPSHRSTRKRTYVRIRSCTEKKYPNSVRTLYNIT